MRPLVKLIVLSGIVVAASTANADKGRLQLGGFGGGHVFSKNNELGVRDSPNADSQGNSFAIGLRGSFGLIDALSLEGELGLVPTEMRKTGESSIVYFWRIHGLYEFLAPSNAFRPFVLAGAGFMSTSQSGDATVADSDLAVYGGGGVTYALNDDWSLRGDARLILPPSSGDQFAATDFEVLLGASFRFGSAGPKFTKVISENDCVDGVGADCPKEVEDQVVVVDTDADGVADEEDACPDRPGKVSTDALRNGCPPSSEKLVVLPDENGHVGGVEVDDGTTITLIDTAYGSSEVGTDGKAQAVAPASAKSVTLAVKTMDVLPPADADDDGVRDRDDACPNRKGEVSSDPLRNGCPPAAERVVVLPDADGHIGGLEIDNGTTKVIVDTAYASAAIGSDGTVDAQPPSQAPVVIDRAIAEIAAVLPPADGDGDGIEDALDACPARKGVTSKKAERNGCPVASEVVVVLPDENGHVGSLEVDDGVTKTVLDTAYATTEVGSNGQAQSVAPAPAGRVLSSLASITATMPKADSDGDGIADIHDSCKDRKGVSSPEPLLHGCPEVIAKPVPVLPKSAGRVNFIVYFDEKALPTRDVDVQIGALIEELKGRDSYSIEVVGHTDGIGSDKRNLSIGLDRANEIARRLVAKGVAPHRVGASTRGSSEPAVAVLDPATTPEPRNRRVEIRIKEAGLPQLVVPFVKALRTTRSMTGEYRALGKRLQGLKGYKVTVVGHSDISEKESGLALKRAQNVARQLRKAGLPPVIEVVSKDASEPAVTDAESQELNRRVEIFINE